MKANFNNLTNIYCHINGIPYYLSNETNSRFVAKTVLELYAKTSKSKFQQKSPGQSWVHIAINTILIDFMIYSLKSNEINNCLIFTKIHQKYFYFNLSNCILRCSHIISQAILSIQVPLKIERN